MHYLLILSKTIKILLTYKDILLWELRYMYWYSEKLVYCSIYTKKTLQENVLRALKVCLEFVIVFPV